MHTHTDPLPPTLIQHLSPLPSFPFPCLAALLPGSAVVTQSVSLFPGSAPSTEASSQSGGVVEGRGVDACVREALSHIPLAAGSRPGLRRGVRLFLTTSQVPALIWELFISCQKTAFPCNCRRRGLQEDGVERRGRRGVWLQNESRARYSKPWA